MHFKDGWMLILRHRIYLLKNIKGFLNCFGGITLVIFGFILQKKHG